jgi:RNA polymerase sigma factor (sigma-70 family)
VAVGLGRAFPEILSAARTGAPWAMESIYRSLAPGVLGYLRGQGARDPDDVASDVFVGVIHGLPRFEGDERAFRAWVFSIAHRRLMDERRRLARRRDHPADPADLGTIHETSATGDVEEEALDSLGTSWALRELQTLSSDQRAVVLLRVLGDLSVEEVARVLEKSMGAVKSLQRRGLKALARRIEREGVS